MMKIMEQMAALTNSNKYVKKGDQELCPWALIPFCKLVMYRMIVTLKLSIQLPVSSSKYFIFDIYDRTLGVIVNIQQLSFLKLDFVFNSKVLTSSLQQSRTKQRST